MSDKGQTSIYLTATEKKITTLNNFEGGDNFMISQKRHLIFQSRELKITSLCLLNHGVSSENEYLYTTVLLTTCCSAVVSHWLVE